MRYNTRELKFYKLLPGRPVAWLSLWASLVLPFFLGMPFSLWVITVLIIGVSDFLISDIKKIFKNFKDDSSVFSLSIHWPQTLEYRFAARAEVVTDNFWVTQELELHFIFSQDYAARHKKLCFHDPASHLQQYINIRPVKKGVLASPEIFICRYSRFGLFKIFYSINNDTKLVSIHPLKALSRRILKLPKNLQVTPVAILGGESQFHSLRPYFPGDSVRFINWKKTAAAENVYLNLYEKEQNRQVYLLINTGMATHFLYRGFEFLDYALAIAWQTASQVLKNGDQTGIMTFDTDMNHFLEARLDRKQARRIYHLLLSTQSAADPANFRQLGLRIRQKIRAGSILLVFSPFLTVPELESRSEFLDSLYGKYTVMWINPVRHSLLDSEKPARLWRKIEDEYAEKQMGRFFAARKTELAAGTPESLLNTILKKYHFLKW